MQDKAVLLMGPTATGKTELALSLSETHPIEIISVDSALIYQDMDIGTAKPTQHELDTVPHHLVNIISPLETYSVAQFIKDSVKLINDVNSRGKIPILVGGTMMYYNALLNGLSVLPESCLATRAVIESKALDIGWTALHAELLEVDAVAAAKIMPNDTQRITRALEVYILSGKPISQLQKESHVHLSKDIQFLPLSIMPLDRSILHERINTRFDKMLANGFIDEVISLRDKYPGLSANSTSMRSVGYAQVWRYLEQEIMFDELSELGKAATRQLAKRQITWLRSMDSINLDDGSLDIDSLFSNLKTEVYNYFEV